MGDMIDRDVSISEHCFFCENEVEARREEAR